MRSRILRTATLTAFLTALLSGLPPAAFGAQGSQTQAPARQAQAAPKAEAPAARTFVDNQDAREVRERLRQILDQYPPSVGQVLRLDPTLISKPDYLEPYPTLAGFLSQHGEVAHNPVFFLGDSRFGYRPEETDKTRALNLMQDVLAGIAVLAVFATVMSLLAWIFRALFDYRYWSRASKIQIDAHTKIFDRLTTNEDVMAYVQSSAGQKFLSATPMTIDVGSRGVSAPISRILWSVQAGVVMTLVGIGLWFARNRAIEELGELLTIIATLAIALGVGFILSALASYTLSRRLGLLEPASRSSNA